MKVIAYKVFDDLENWEESTYTYNYATTEREKEYLEKWLTDVPYKKEEYRSIYEFLCCLDQLKDDGFTDGEKLDFVLECVREIESGSN